MRLGALGIVPLVAGCATAPGGVWLWVDSEVIALEDDLPVLVRLEADEWPTDFVMPKVRATEVTCHQGDCWIVVNAHQTLHGPLLVEVWVDLDGDQWSLAFEERDAEVVDALYPEPEDPFGRRITRLGNGIRELDLTLE